MTRLIFSALLALNISVLSTGASATDSGEGKGAEIKDDWIIINKDYSSQRYVDLDQITPANVSGLNEVCEIQLNEPIWFSSGILKVGRTLYVSTSRVTYAFDERKQRPGYLDGKISRGTGDGRVIGSMPRPARCYGTRWARQTLPNMRPSIRPDCLAGESVYRHLCRRFGHSRTPDGQCQHRQGAVAL